MKGNSDVVIMRANDALRPSVISLLDAEKLPVSDLPASLTNFLVAMDKDKVVGAIGLELFGDYGLLRSMVVTKQYRNHKIASRLVSELENFAKASGITSIYLLTETAAQYFRNKNYKIVSRNEVPMELQASSEFSHVCPVSALVLKKQII